MAEVLRSWWLVALVGCSFRPGTLATDSGTDMGITIGDDAPDGSVPCTSWQPHHFDACAIPLATEEDQRLVAVGSPYTFDTTTAGGELRDNAGDPVTITTVDYEQSDTTHVALWTMADFTVDSGVELRVIGAKPLVIAAWGGIAIAGTIDASSYRNVRTGAGSNPAVCAGASAATSGLDGTSGNGGGGGGGFGGNGGIGGTGDGNCSVAPGCYRTGGKRGDAVGAPTIARGGCDGAASGASGGTRAAGGRGGGAVVLASRAAIAIAGTVLAGGAGGSGDPGAGVSTGGGGGGAGGLIGLDAPTVVVSGATLAANGGAGGAGSDIANAGVEGGDGRPDGTAATGGATGGGGTNGGDGSSQGVPDAASAPNPGTPPVGGGGGGGGGAGFILYWSTNFIAASGVRSPDANAGP